MKTNFRIKAILRDLKLFLQTPKDFLYSFTIPQEKKIKVFPYNPATRKIAHEVMAEINSLCQDHRIYFIGSASLKIDGQNDIDMYIACPESKLKINGINLRKSFGQPNKMRRSYMQWKFFKDGFLIEMVLIDSTSPILAGQLELFNILRQPRVLNEYKKLKLKLNNTPLREYTRIRMEFFNNLLRNKSR